ncbi:MAG: threonine synthase [Nitrospiraceae bacterium]|nr:MAG: threonine synthase [Nitrospiraceae bacterium]
MTRPWHGLINRYGGFLPVSEKTPVITLNEGNTPLLAASHIQEIIKEEISIYFKFEGTNPTGSFKDRGMTLAISKAAEEKARAVICASTGNTSASASAYSARAGISCIVIIPEGKIAMGKLAQAMIHGAMVIQIDGNFDDALRMVKEIVAKYPIVLVNSLNPFRIEGQKTAAFEVCDHLGKPPVYHALPVGNAGNITAYWKGYKEYRSAGKISSLPKMIGFQAAGAAPIVLGHPVTKPETVATAIRIGNPASWKSAEAARDESGGRIDSVTDDEILEAYKFIASREGIFCEPASAASLAGVIKLSKQDYFRKGDTIVCTLTGHGLKDPDNALKISAKPIKIKASLSALEDTIRGCCI